MEPFPLRVSKTATWTVGFVKWATGFSQKLGFKMGKEKQPSSGLDNNTPLPSSRPT